MPQQQTLYPGFTAERFLLYMASLRRMPRARALERIDWALGAVGLSDVRGKTIRSLSGGMKQRLLLAQAILDEPVHILILDEPTAGLDPRQRIAVRNLIAEIALQKIVIVSTPSCRTWSMWQASCCFCPRGGCCAKASPAELTHELAGQVWEAELAESELPAAQAARTVCSIARVDAGHIRVRLLAEKQPPFACRPLAPELEDVSALLRRGGRAMSYELRKILGNRYVMLLLALAVAVNAALFYRRCTKDLGGFTRADIRAEYAHLDTLEQGV